MPRRKVSEDQLKMIKERSKSGRIMQRRALLEKIARDSVATEITEDDIKREVGGDE